MNIFRNLANLPNFEGKNIVLTIGTYDGVHLGHQKIIAHINGIARKIGGESMLITFHPHPRIVINNNFKIQLLSPLEEKFELLKTYGIDHVVVVPFTRDFSQQLPQTYVQDFLVKNFRPKRIVVGYNHRFGKNRAGNINLLRALGVALGFDVTEIGKQEVDSLGISSTKIRAALNEGAVQIANILLGHTYGLQGIVVEGKQLGQQIGFPTANIVVEESNKLIPANGVYAVRVKVRGVFYYGMLNIGLRPTVNQNMLLKTIEVHIFDFACDIYGEKIAVHFVAPIRKEQKFANINALVEQLKRDEQTVRSLFSNN